MGKKPASVNASKGRRYSKEERREVLSFVREFDTLNGRGGIAAAIRKFGIPRLTIGKRRTKEGVLPPATLSTGNPKRQLEVLNRMVVITQKIASLEQELSALRLEYKRIQGWL